MKIAPIIEAMDKAKANGSRLRYRLIHTGQHYDRNMSGSFFEQLGIPDPDINLNVGSGTQAEQTAGIMLGYEKVLLKQKSDLCIVVGDVTSTMACAITAQKLHIPVAHVEGGIRSGDWTMPEEINRMATDAVTNWFFTTSEFANENLRNSGVEEDRIFFVGNTMIDTLLTNLPRLQKPAFWDEAVLKDKNYFVLTLHRPNNVDEQDNLKHLLETIINGSYGLPIIFPVHPRTAKILDKMHLDKSNLFTVEPLSYLEFNFLVKNALAVITDSGGITEEATVLGVPCMTMRSTTERSETVTIGTNELVGTDPAALKPYLELLFAGHWKKGKIPPLWDGKTAKRIINHLEIILQ
jgi:UDP-N-acetylglucosamine 2-epimerase (non-hydrolysing)